MDSAAFPIDSSVLLFSFRKRLSKLYAIWPLAMADASNVLLSVFERNEILPDSAAG
jgi:hypothetical protein